MSEYTPSTDEVRDSYDYAYTLGISDISRIAEFDRWLAEVKAEAWDEGWYAGYKYGLLMYGEYRTDNPYRKETE